MNSISLTYGVLSRECPQLYKPTIDHYKHFICVYKCNPAILPYTIPAIVTEVSAKFVATTTLRVFGGVR